jgi:GNAT superfamily N-acetyltransferase
MSSKADRPDAPLDVAVKCYPLTPDRWTDFEILFGPRGACGGCWCMWWRLPRSKYERRKGLGNKEAVRRLVRGNRTPGLLAYIGGEPVGWCAASPREEYPRLESSKILQRVDHRPVWSITCFFIAKPWRHRGLTVTLLRAVVAFAARQDCKIVEGYPVEPKNSDMPDVFASTGIASAFRKAGFRDVARRAATRPIVRI